MQMQSLGCRCRRRGQVWGAGEGFGMQETAPGSRGWAWDAKAGWKSSSRIGGECRIQGMQDGDAAFRMVMQHFKQRRMVEALPI